MNTTSLNPIQNQAVANAVNTLNGRIDTIVGGDVYTKSEVNQLLANKVTQSDIDTSISTLLTTMYPVGSVYIGTQATCPMATLIANSTWELVSSGKALWTGNGTNGNSTINAGLPNITATWGGTTYGNAAAQICINGVYNGITSVPVSGAATVTNLNTDGADYSCGGSAFHGLGGVKLGFNASSSNSIYGNSSTVQPPAYVVNVWRRTA